jgi:hypothetical protein
MTEWTDRGKALPGGCLQFDAEIVPGDDLFLHHRLMTKDGGERRRGPSLMSTGGGVPFVIES